MRQFSGPSGVGVDAAGNVYVADGNNRVQKFKADGTYLTQWAGGVGDGQFNNVTDRGSGRRRQRVRRGLQQQPHPEVQRRGRGAVPSRRRSSCSPGARKAAATDSSST